MSPIIGYSKTKICFPLRCYEKGAIPFGFPDKLILTGQFPHLLEER